MKKITKDTVLKQGNKVYSSVVISDIFYWVDKEAIIDANTWFSTPVGVYKSKTSMQNKSTDSLVHKIVAQSQPILDIKEIPVIDLAANNVRLIIDGEDPFELHLYTQKDIERAIDLAGNPQRIMVNGLIREHLTKEEILEQIDSISVIEVDEYFNIVDYE
jgi:hypothetical protein